MIKMRRNCMVCGYEPVCIGGYWTFMPLFCCETKKSGKTASQSKKSR